MATTTGDLLTTITPRQVMAGDLPWRAAGVRWPDAQWTECREHLTHPQWWVEPHVEDTIGEIIWDPDEVRCDLCAEDVQEEDEDPERA